VVRGVGNDHDPHDKHSALQVLDEAHRKGEILTGLLYIAEKEPDFSAAMKVVNARPLAAMDEADCRPPREAFDRFIAGHR